MDSIILLGLGLDAWLTILLLLAMFGLMMFSKIPAEFVFLGGMGFLCVTGILDTEQALSGFSASSVVVIGVLFVVIAGLVHSGVVHWMVKRVLGTPSSYSTAIVRMMVPVAVFSSFLNNTTVVALFMKVVKEWAKKLDIRPSKLLIPLSYAASLGGICTLIGTPPNLIISGMLASEKGTELNIFSTTIPGLFCLAVGIVFILLTKRLLPDRKSSGENFEDTQVYTAELLVPSASELIGKTIADAGLMNVRGGRLLEIVRFDHEVVSPVSPDEYIMGGDRLVYSGQVDTIKELRTSHGLTVATKPVFSVDKDEKNRQFCTASVRRGSVLIGTSMEECDFEETHSAVLVAVVREGERIDQNPRSVKLQYADVLLFECQRMQLKNFSSSAEKDLRFLNFEEAPATGRRTLLAGAIMLAMVLLSTFGVMSLLQSCFLAAAAMLVTRCCTTRQAWESINWPIVMVFAGSVCLGTAIEETGIATAIADGILSACGTNALVVLFCICFVATFITEFISNTACAAMFFPIAYQTAVSLDVNPVTFCIALMIAVSSSFATPIGSPTNMLVYGEGGYRFTDFMRIGLLMNIVILVANIFIVTLLFPL